MRVVSGGGAVAALAVVAATAAAPSAAIAAPRALVRGVDLQTPPVLSGERVLWGERTAGGGLAVRAAGGAGPRTLFRFAAPSPPTRLRFGALDASETHVAFVRVAFRPTGGPAPRSGSAARARGAGGSAGRSDIAPRARGGGAPSDSVAPAEDEATRSTLLAGPLGGPFALLSGRGGAPPGRGGCRAGRVEPREVAVSGPRVLWTETVTACGPRGERVRDRLLVADLRRGPAARVLFSSPAYPPGAEPPVSASRPRLAGRFAAYRRDRPGRATSNGVVVDLRTGRRRLERGNLLEWFAVAPDGALVTSRHTPDGSHELTLRAPRRGGAPPTVLGPLGGGFGGPEERLPVVAAAGRRVAFVAVTDRPRLVVAGRDGGRRTVTTLGPRRRLRMGFDFDGRRVAWATGPPARATIWTLPL